MNLSELATTIETLKKDNEELKFFVQVLLIGQAAYPWASRDEAMRIESRHIRNYYKKFRRGWHKET